MDRRQTIHDMTTAVPHVGTLATLAGWLPPIAALFSIIWIALQIAEKLTGQPAHVLAARAWRGIVGVWKRLLYPR